jgi:hypothetical protein
MLRNHGRRGAASALALAALLGGCVSLDRRDWTVADSGSGGMFRASWGGMRSDRPEDSETIRRVRGVEVPREPLEVEPGSVWPAEEAPRVTLANPDAALRGVPAYRPGEPRNPERLWDDRPPRDPAPRADGMLPPEDERSTRPPRRRGASSPPPPPLVQPMPDRLDVLPVPPGANAPPAPRTDGQVVLTPGGPVVTTGGTDRVQGFVAPGGGSGVVVRDGGVTTVVPSGGAPQTFPTRR